MQGDGQSVSRGTNVLMVMLKTSTKVIEMFLVTKMLSSVDGKLILAYATDMLASEKG